MEEREVDSVGVGMVMAFILCGEGGVVASTTLSAISANLSKVGWRRAPCQHY